MAEKNQAEVISTTIFDLPFDDIIVPHIAVYLNHWDLLNMLEASRESQVFREFVEGIIGAVKHFRIAKHWYPFNVLYPFVVKNCRKLRIIEIFDMPLEESLIELIANNPLINKIAIRYCQDFEDIFSLAATCKNLTHLELTRLEFLGKDHFLEVFAKNKILLRHFSLFISPGLTEKGLAGFFAGQPSLRSIELDALDFQDVRSTLHTIGRNCRDLEELTLIRSEFVEDDVVREIKENCPKLRIFRVTSRFTRPISNWSYKKIFQSSIVQEHRP